MYLKSGRRVPYRSPAEMDRVTMFDVGPTTVGVSFRSLEGRTVPRNGALEGQSDAVLHDGGVKIHVFGADDAVEHVPFDCFWHDPHYHYSCPDSEEWLVIPYDSCANGSDVVTCVLQSLRSHMRTILANTRGKHLVRELKLEKLVEALDQVERAARHSQFASSTT